MTQTQTTTPYDEAVRALAHQVAGTVVTQSTGPARDVPATTSSPPYAAPSSTPDSASEDQERFLGSLLNTFVPIISQAVPTFLQALQQQNRDLGLTVERDADALERDFASVFGGLLQPLITDCFPKLLSQIQVLSRDVDPQDTDVVEERWLLPLLTTVIPAVAQAVPGIINAFSSQRGIESEVSVSDPEIADRFFGPLLGSVASGLIGQLPGLISLFNPPQRDLQLNWVNFTGQWLPDGDVVRTVETDLGDPRYIEFALRQPWGTWWKGVELWVGGQRVGELGVQDSRREAGPLRIETAQVAGAGYLQFLKAKMFGVHTGMYRLGGLDQKAGKRVTFEWMHG